MPHLERGRPRKARAEAGAAPHELVHRSVDELHINLPFEITEKRKELAALEDKVRTNEARAEKARIKAETDDDPGISTAVTSTPTSSRLAMNATFVPADLVLQSATLRHHNNGSKLGQLLKVYGKIVCSELERYTTP